MFVYCKHYVSLYFDSSGRSGVIEIIYVFIQHAEKHGCVSTRDKNRTCVGQVCGFLYLFIRKLHARGFTHAMHDVPETKASPRNKAVWTSSRVVRRFYHFYAYLRLDYKALGRSVYAGYS